MPPLAHPGKPLPRLPPSARPFVPSGVRPMNRDLGRVSRNDSEEIRLSLREVRGELCLELRVYTRSAHHGGMPVPDPEAIVVPIRVLSDLCRVLQQSHDRLVKEGLEAHPSRPTVVTMATTSPPTPRLR